MGHRSCARATVLCTSRRLLLLTRVIAELDGALPGLDASAWLFGSVRIRNRATIGGNLGNASPAGDTIPPLVAAGAVAVLEGANGSRRVAVADLATGPGRTVVGPDEWIDRIEIPLPAGEEGFRKFGTRQADAISIVSLAWRWEKDADGKLTNVSLALGAVAPTVVRARRTEAELEGRRPEPRVVEAAVAALSIGYLADRRPARECEVSKRRSRGYCLREELGVRRRARPRDGQWRGHLRGDLPESVRQRAASIRASSYWLCGP